MKKTVFSLAAVLAALFAASAFAQSPGPGQDRAPASAATPAEKAVAKQARKVEGTAAAKADQPADDKPATTASKKVSDKEKALAKAKRKTEGADATKAPKDKSGPAS